MSSHSRPSSAQIYFASAGLQRMFRGFFETDGFLSKRWRFSSGSERVLDARGRLVEDGDVRSSYPAPLSCKLNGSSDLLRLIEKAWEVAQATFKNLMMIGFHDLDYRRHDSSVQYRYHVLRPLGWNVQFSARRATPTWMR